MRFCGSERITHVPVEMQPSSAYSAPSDFRLGGARPSRTATRYCSGPIPTNSLAAYQALHDVYGKPAVIIRVLLPRTIYQQGHTSLLQFLLLLLAAGLLFGAATMFLLERFVISRAAALSDDIAAHRHERRSGRAAASFRQR